MNINKNVIEVIMRQTDYSEEKAIEKLKEHNNVLTIVREYMGVKPTPPSLVVKSVNQLIYGEIRIMMDDAAKRYSANKEYEKYQEAYTKQMQETKNNAETIE
jgi:hypothetical protein